MDDHYDIAVLGAGPAGANAALQAAQQGCRVVLLDEQRKPGGQVWRAKNDAIASAPETPESLAGNELRRAVVASDLVHQGSARVWQIEKAPEGGEGWTLHLIVADRSIDITARALVLATGAREYVQPIPGWTTPGVIGLGGATALMKQALLPPGKNTVVAGTGPLVFFVAGEIHRLGGKVAAIVTPNSRADWVRSLPAMSRRPDLVARGMVWLADQMLAGTPIFWRHAVSKVYDGNGGGESCVRSVKISRVKPDWTPLPDGPTITADALCLGNGLIPSIEAAQLLGVEISHEPNLGGWVPRADRDGKTNVGGVYVCGDSAGIRGAAAAVIHGNLTGLSAAEFVGKSIGSKRPKLHARYCSAAKFGLAMTALSTARPGLAKLTTSDTIICRCESVSQNQILSEIRSGASSTNAVKSGLRSGMGLCGGKFCQTAIGRIIASVEEIDEGSVPPPTPRPPLCPVPASALAGEFDYADLPIPKPAPL